MKNTIERTLFWFNDGDNKLLQLNERFFSLSVLLNRLLSEKYIGKKIQFINLFFRTEKTYKLHPQAEKFFVYFYDKQLTYDDVFDLESFNKLNKKDQSKFLWKRAYEILQEASIFLKNKQLLFASDYAYNKGIEMGLNADYRMVSKDVVLFNQNMKASVWVNFKEDKMFSSFTLENNGDIFFKKEIDKTQSGIEYFLEIYKDIEQTVDGIIIRGNRNVEYLPLKISLEEIKIKD